MKVNFKSSWISQMSKSFIAGMRLWRVITLMKKLRIVLLNDWRRRKLWQKLYKNQKRARLEMWWVHNCINVAKHKNRRQKRWNKKKQFKTWRSSRNRPLKRFRVIWISKKRTSRKGKLSVEKGWILKINLLRQSCKLLIVYRSLVKICKKIRKLGVERCLAPFW